MFKFRIDKEAIEELNKILKKNNLSEIEIKDGKRSIKLSRMPSNIKLNNSNNMEEEDQAINTTTENIKTKDQYSSKNYVKAPMLGTLYHASSPKAKPFIVEGSKVKVGDVIFIIEAMKTMNQVKSDREGVVKKILVENGMPVEYDQDLLIIE